MTHTTDTAAARLARLEWGGSRFRTATDLATAALYEWITAGGLNSRAESRGFLIALDLPGMRKEWGDATTDFIVEHLGAARERCHERLDAAEG
jgi:hypothetical protein